MNERPTVAYLFQYYPILTQPFQHREIAGLCEQGFRVEIHSIFGSADKVDELAPAHVPVHHFCWWRVVLLPIALVREWSRDPALWRDGWRLLRAHRFPSWENFWATISGTVFALCSAPRFRAHPPQLLHGVWATGPATAAAILSRCCGIPFSMGAHAFDLHRHGGDAFLQPKLRAARLVYTTTQANAAFLKAKANGRRVNILVCRRGLAGLAEPQARRHPGPIRILSVARLIPKKGHVHQLAACAVLKRWRIPFTLKLIGDGQLRARLQTRIVAEGLTDHVIVCGAWQPRQVPAAYQWADIFWHTGVIDADGDRDGLPNVIPEALSYGLPVICGKLDGPREAITHEDTGLVVDVTNAVELAAAVKRLVEDEPLRQRLGENGRGWVEENFLISKNTAVLAEAFRAAARPKQDQSAPSRFWRAFVHSPTVQRIFVWTMRRLFRLRMRHTELVTMPQPYIFASNHASHYDLFLALAAFRHEWKQVPVPVVWRGVFDIPIIGGIVQALPSVAVEHGFGHGAGPGAALRAMIGHLRAGRCLIMACEGRRQDALGEFEHGAAFVSLRTGALVVPVSLRGAQGLYRKLARPDRFWGNVEIVLHPPLDPAAFEALGGTRAEIVARFTQAIREQVATELDYAVKTAV